MHQAKFRDFLLSERGQYIGQKGVSLKKHCIPTLCAVQDEYEKSKQIHSVRNSNTSSFGHRRKVRAANRARKYMEISLSESFSRSTKTICSIMTSYQMKLKTVSGGVQITIKHFKNIDILNIDLHKGKFGYSEEIAEEAIFNIRRDTEYRSFGRGKEVSQTCCGAVFREVYGKHTIDDGLNRALGLCTPAHSSQPLRQTYSQSTFCYKVAPHHTDR